VLPPEMVKKCLSRMSGKLSRTVLRRGRGSNPFSLVEYASFAVQLIHDKIKALVSMSRKGDCWDNAPSEAFFSTLKLELVYGKTFKTKQEALSCIFEFIEIDYNRWRLHSTLGYKAPHQFEEDFRSLPCVQN